MNDLGQVVGSSSVAGDGATHAFLYSQGEMRDLGVLAGGTNSSGASINASGQVVGSSEAFVTDWLGCGPWNFWGCAGLSSRAFRYSDGTMTDLGGLNWWSRGPPRSYGYGINDAGVAVGGANSDSGDLHAVIFEAGSVQVFPGSGVNPIANAINNAGQIVGTGLSSGGGFLYDHGTVTRVPGPGCCSSTAEDINQDGLIVGLFRGRAYVWDGTATAVTPLGTLGGSMSEAYGISDLGVVVGASEIAGDTETHAFMYSGGAMTDLNDLVPANPSWILQRATAINNVGQIVGVGLHHGQQRAFLLSFVVGRPG